MHDGVVDDGPAQRFSEPCLIGALHCGEKVRDGGIVSLSGCGQSSQMPNDVGRYARYRFPAAIIGHTVWLYYRFTLSFRDVEEFLAHRGITVLYESIRHWCATFGLAYARRLRHRPRQSATRGIWTNSL